MIGNAIKSIFNSLTNWRKSPIAAPPIQPNVPVTPIEQLITNDTISKISSFTIPARQDNLLSGSQFAETIMNVGPGVTRENMILEEVTKGNIPDFMRNPIIVNIVNGNYHVSYCALPDVLCIGNDADFLRVPLTPGTAQKIATLFNATLPTKLMADQIWQGANVKMTPIPGGPPYDASMRATSKFVNHNKNIELQRNGRSGLITGHKKDVIISKQLLTSYPNNVVIYGWFGINGVPIQGMNPRDHDKNYEDYSHGLRYICKSININNQTYNFYDVLNNPNLAFLISHEGAYDATRIYQ